MQMLVEQQGEHLNTIVENADTTVNELERGNKHVDSAIKKARATRAKKWCCFVLTIILAVVIAILVWWFAFNVSLVSKQCGFLHCRGGIGCHHRY